MRALLKKLSSKKVRGATIVEYILLVSLIALGTIGAFRWMGNVVEDRIWNAGHNLYWH